MIEASNWDWAKNDYKANKPREIGKNKIIKSQTINVAMNNHSTTWAK